MNTGVTTENPMGLNGFEFVEFSALEAGKLEPISEPLGFTRVVEHRSKVCKLFLPKNSPLSYLSCSKNAMTGAVDMQLEVLIQTSLTLKKVAVL